MQDLIKSYFTESIQTQIVTAEALSETIEVSAQKLVQALLNGNKILSCGNGASAANAQNFTSKLINGVEIERPSMPAISLVSDAVVLSAIANGGQHDEIYAKQIQALGQSGDILLVISSEGVNSSIIRAVQESVIKDMAIIALTGCDGGEIVGLLGQHDIEIRIPSYKKVRIQEMHTLVLDCLCQLIEHSLFMYKE
ncbi:SIS domain-containing protein [Zophobihabitans entericus]|uniref:SIS domain-containing protein n=1 Tax=Zophobihabitans entericus TaxID=1635327 RepID=A0A6G9I7U0_9GAMM|nr:SIS domain-containing protein [Zophobihabitans entericus]QIQ20275.1 SIS domain-containing protein [Zophobihabitans entericus]